jgi:hypothetical protein
MRHEEWATPRNDRGYWGCCFAIMEPDGAHALHDKLRAASAADDACVVRARVREEIGKREKPVG